MSKLLSIIMAASLLVFPFATFAVDYGSQSSQTQQVPPVAQTLVREGDFAIKLATELGLGSPTEEAAAEEMLAKAGVLPVNGWISDYPVTPEIIGQLNDSDQQGFCGWEVVHECRHCAEGTCRSGSVKWTLLCRRKRMPVKLLRKTRPLLTTTITTRGLRS